MRKAWLLFVIKLTHTVFTLYMFASLFYIIYCHVHNRRGPILTAAYYSVLFESLLFGVSGRVCPLRRLVDRLYAPGTPDIFLPPAISRRVTPAGMSLLALALLTKLMGLLLEWRRRD